MRIFQSPQPIEPTGAPAVFLAGSIEMGKAIDWQQAVCEHFADKEVTIFNPRRADWDATWRQSADDPRFHAQVTWELDALERCDLILMNLLPGTISPVSLLELGLFAHSGKLHVCCPADFHRAGNVEIVCTRYGIPLYRTLPELLNNLPLFLFS